MEAFIKECFNITLNAAVKALPSTSRIERSAGASRLI
jgi:hypothetical protein